MEAMRPSPFLEQVRAAIGVRHYSIRAWGKGSPIRNRSPDEAP